MLEKADYKRLTKAEQAMVKLAYQARHDTLYGGADALVLAERLQRMGAKFPAEEIVSYVYSHSTAVDQRAESWGGPWVALKCPECGQAYLGADDAYACCSQMGDYDDS
jgi:hypothetical protein